MALLAGLVDLVEEETVALEAVQAAAKMAGAKEERRDAAMVVVAASAKRRGVTMGRRRAGARPRPRRCIRKRV